MPVDLDPTLFRTFLIGSFTRYRTVYTTDGAGGAIEAIEDAGAEDGRMRPMRPQEIEAAARLDVQASHILYVEAPSDIDRGDYIVNADRPGIRYRVVAPQEPSQLNFLVQWWLMEERSPMPPEAGS